MPKIIFDIETVGCEMDSFDEATRVALLKYAKTDVEEQEVRDSMSFYPLTAQIVTIAMLEVDCAKAFVYYQTPGEQPQKVVEGDAEYISVANEKQLLELFWKKIEKYDQFITFNGRAFDCPFIMIRSGINRLKASRNLMPDRYRSGAHIDLMEKLTFLGASRKKFSLHMWCNAFGIKSPKDEGITGLDVKGLFKAGKHFDIARYCLRDVAATKELHSLWDKYINFPV
ncbi:MAG: ribonuclease H-like domain-containing protein [Candidatus Omnitrophica bacterium]|nr:ribonuclease H-like domain-containing protein [Candidatus Omnitrophota bacterium]